MAPALACRPTGAVLLITEVMEEEQEEEEEEEVVVVVVVLQEEVPSGSVDWWLGAIGPGAGPLVSFLDSLSGTGGCQNRGVCRSGHLRMGGRSLRSTEGGFAPL